MIGRTCIVTTRQINKKLDYSLRAEKYFNDEIGELIDSFNEMLIKIENQSAKLIKAEKLDSLSVLARWIAHDFNNMLHLIRLNVQITKAKLESMNIDEEVTDFLDSAEKSIMRAVGLTKQLFIFAKGELPVKKTVSLTQYIKRYR